MTRRVLGVAVSAAVALVLAVSGCSKSSGGDDGGGTASSVGVDEGTAVSVTLTRDGCDASQLTAPAGKVTFKVTGGGSGAVTELEVQKSGRILSERENIAPGFKASFSVSLDPGSYTLYCPGGGKDSHAFTVTAAQATPAASPSV